MKIRDARMPMPVLVSLMPMPVYDPYLQIISDLAELGSGSTTLVASPPLAYAAPPPPAVRELTLFDPHHVQYKNKQKATSTHRALLGPIQVCPVQGDPERIYVQ